MPALPLAAAHRAPATPFPSQRTLEDFPEVAGSCPDLTKAARREYARDFYRAFCTKPAQPVAEEQIQQARTA